jgi:hypothetical protein
VTQPIAKSLDMKKKIIYGVLIVIVGIQFIRTDEAITEYEATDDFINHTEASTEISKLITTSCYDCHSNNTYTPWYGEIAPVSWWINDHINEGREELNFSAWGTYELKKKEHKLEEMMEYVEKRWMPMSSYLKLHGDAEFSDEEKTLLVNWLTSVELAPKNNAPVLRLNNGEKWKANEETTASIKRMFEIAKEEIDEGRLSHYAAMGERLNLEKEALFSNCTMTGEEHNQLHIFIMPLINKFESLEFVSNEGEAMILQKDILKDLNNYHNFFE